MPNSEEEDASGKLRLNHGGVVPPVSAPLPARGSLQMRGASVARQGKGALRRKTIMGNAELAVLCVPLAAGAILEIADTIGRYGDVVRTWSGILLISHAKVFGILCAIAIVTFRTNEQWLIGMSVLVALFVLSLWPGRRGERWTMADGSALRENVAIRNVVSTMPTQPRFGVLRRESSLTAPKVSSAVVMRLPDVIVTAEALAVLTPGELQAVVARQLVLMLMGQKWIMQ